MTDATATPAAPPAPIAKPVSDDAGNLRKFLERHKDAIIAAAGNQISPERVLKVALLAATKSTKLSDPKLDRMSFLRAVVTAASLGLEPGSALGEGYLVPYWNSKRGVFEVEFQIGYRGFVALARRSGSIVSIDSRPVFKGEKFEPHYGTDPKIVHVPNFDIDRTPEFLVAVYTVWHLEDGGIQFDVMSVKEVDRIRARSKASGDGPWQTDYLEMAKKTVTRRSAKLVPMSSEMADAIDEDARREFGDLDLGVVANSTNSVDSSKGAGAKLAEAMGVGNGAPKELGEGAAQPVPVPQKGEPVEAELVDDKATAADDAIDAARRETKAEEKEILTVRPARIAKLLDKQAKGKLTEDEGEELRDFTLDHPELFPESKTAE